MKAKTFIFIIYCIALWQGTGCGYKKTDYSLHADVIQYTSRSLDPYSIIGNNYRIIHTVVKNGKLLLKATRNKLSYFIGIDIKTRKLLFNMADPQNDYIFTSFDVYGDSLYSLLSLKPGNVYITNIATGNKQIKPIVYEKKLVPVRIASNRNQLFLFKDVYGVGFINKNNYNSTIFYNGNGEGIVNPLSSTLAFPVSDSINLLSGHVIKDWHTIQLYAVDNRDSIRWKHVITQDSRGEAVAMLNIKDRFVVKYDSNFVALNKEDGKLLWHNLLDDHIKEIYQWEDKVLVYSLINVTGYFPHKDDHEYTIKLKLFDCNSGKELWQAGATSLDPPSIGICGDKLVVTDNVSISTFLLSNGKMINRKLFPKKERYHYGFEMLEDEVTGEKYIRSYDDKVYW